MTRAKGPSYVVYYRRRREGKTDYAKRLALVKSGKTRMVVRRSNKGLVIQLSISILKETKHCLL